MTVADDGVFRVETVHLDLPAVVGAFSQRLRVAGVPVTPERSAHFAQALTLTKPISRRRLYWTARAVFVSDSAQGTAFDGVFFSVFRRRPTIGRSPSTRPRAASRAETIRGRGYRRPRPTRETATRTCWKSRPR